MTKLHLGLLAIIISSYTVAAVDANCDKELDDYLGFLATTAMASGGMIVALNEMESFIRSSIEEKSTQGSCVVLTKVKKSSIAQKLADFVDMTEKRATIETTNTVDVDAEIDWSDVSDNYAGYDLSRVENYSETVKRCIQQHPNLKASADLAVEAFLKRVDYPALRKKVKDSMVANGQGSTYAIKQMMARGGEDTRQWSQEQCEDYFSNAPFDRLYANRKNNAT